MILDDVHRGIQKNRERRRIGRGPGSGHGKTSGRGHKGQKSRKSPGPRAGFEGGQMPLQRRSPKFGFTSMKGRSNAEVRLDALARCEGDVIDLASLRAAGLVSGKVKRVKIIASGTLDRAVTVKGLAATKGARQAIESSGGKVEA